MAVEPQLSDQEIVSRMEIPHPSMGPGGPIDATTLRTEHPTRPGGAHVPMVGGQVDASPASATAVRPAIRPRRTGFASALCCAGSGSLDARAVPEASRMQGGIARRSRDLPDTVIGHPRRVASVNPAWLL